MLFAATLLLVACDNNQSIQEYYVESSEKPDFISVDLPASLLKLEESTLTPEQKQAYQSLKKLNVLAYRATESNKAAFEAEKAKVKQILVNDNYKELMRFSIGKNKATIKYKGESDALDEVIVYGSDDTKGFALVRVLGDNMQPSQIMKLANAINENNIETKELEQLSNFFKN